MDEIKRVWLNSRKRFILNALFLGTIFGLFGWFLVGYGFLNPVVNTQASSNIEITATGGKNENSKSSEVWFYGAFRVGDDKKISWNQFVIDPS